MIHESVIFENSEMDKNVTLWPQVKVRNSKLSEGVSIGEFSEIIGTTIGDFGSINRRNFVFRSHFNRFTYTGENCSIRSTEIGSFVSIGPAALLGGGNHSIRHTSTFNLSRFENALAGYSTSSASLGIPLRSDVEARLQQKDNLKIGNDVWIGSGVIALRGCVIGDGAVVGAGAVVTRDVEPYSIVAGIPARIINQRFETSVVERLLRLRWWDWPLKK